MEAGDPANFGNIYTPGSNRVIVFGRNGAMSIFEKFSWKYPGKRQFGEIFINKKLQQFWAKVEILSFFKITAMLFTFQI